MATLGLLLLLAPSGCSKILGIDDTTQGDRDATASDGGNADAQDPTVVAGRVYDIYVFQGQETEVPRDLTSVTIQALLGDGVGGYTNREATIGANGTFSIADMPNEEYWLRVGDRYYRTSDRTLTVITKSYRRPVVNYPTTETILAFELDSLTPWTNESSIEVSSPAGVRIFLAGPGVFPTPAVGATTFAGENDYALLLGAGIENLLLEGDPLYITQLGSRQTTDALAYESVQSYAAPAPLTQTDGQRSTLSATLAPVSDTHQLTATWPGVALDALHPDMCPAGAYQGDARLSVTTGGGYTLLLDAVPGPVDGTHSFGLANPLPNGSQLGLKVYQLCGIPSEDLGGLATLTGFYRDAMPFETAPSLAPKVGPPRLPRVDAQDAMQEILLASPGGEISWTRPTLGSPDRFVVSISDIGTGQRTWVASFYTSTSETTVRLPPSILRSGHVYAIRIGSLIGQDPLDPSTWNGNSTQAVLATASIIVGHPPIIFVDADTGDDTQSGTSTSPYKTISHALSVATSGDEIRVEDGIYDAANGETFPLEMGDGVALVAIANSATIRGGGSYAGVRATVSPGNDSVLSGFIIEMVAPSSGAEFAVTVFGARTQVLDNQISETTKMGTGIWVGSGADHVIRGNTITGHESGVVIGFTTGAVLLESNQITGNGTGLRIDTDVAGVDLGGGGAGSAGGNTFSCNTYVDIDKLQAPTVSAHDNLWDHVPPVTSISSVTNGDDLHYLNASVGLLDTSGAGLTGSPCL